MTGVFALADRRWRYFGTREVKLARVWAWTGGIAVHENLFRSQGRRTAHLLAPDEALLIGAARLLGCRAHWIQRTRTAHFDLVERHLERALYRCGVDPADGPVRIARDGPGVLDSCSGMLRMEERRGSGPAWCMGARTRTSPSGVR